MFGWLLDLIAVRGEVVVQFWLQPGEHLAVFGWGDDLPADPIPVELRPFLF